MPALVLVPASPSDIENLASLQIEAWAEDVGFTHIFPKGATPDTIQHTIAQTDKDMDDMTQHIMLVKDAFSCDIAAYAKWHFQPQKNHDEIEREMLIDCFPLPKDANLELGNRLIHNATRKHHEIVTKHFGHGAAHAYLHSIATSLKYRRQGAASMLMQWGVDRADDLRLPTYIESAPQAKELYLKFGFEVVDTLKLDIPSPENFNHFCVIRQRQT